MKLQFTVIDKNSSATLSQSFEGDTIALNNQYKELKKEIPFNKWYYEVEIVFDCGLIDESELLFDLD